MRFNYYLYIAWGLQLYSQILHFFLTIPACGNPTDREVSIGSTGKSIVLSQFMRNPENCPNSVITSIAVLGYDCLSPKNNSMSSAYSAIFSAPVVLLNPWILFDALIAMVNGSIAKARHQRKCFWTFIIYFNVCSWFPIQQFHPVDKPWTTSFLVSGEEQYWLGTCHFVFQPGLCSSFLLAVRSLDRYCQAPSPYEVMSLPGHCRSRFWHCNTTGDVKEAWWWPFDQASVKSEAIC